MPAGHAEQCLLDARQSHSAHSASVLPAPALTDIADPARAISADWILQGQSAGLNAEVGNFNGLCDCLTAHVLKRSVQFKCCLENLLHLLQEKASLAGCLASPYEMPERWGERSEETRSSQRASASNASRCVCARVFKMRDHKAH